MVVKTLKPVFKTRSGYPESSPKAWHPVGVLLEVTQEHGRELAQAGQAEIVQHDGALEMKQPSFEQTGAKDKDAATAAAQKKTRNKKTKAS